MVDDATKTSTEALKQKYDLAKPAGAADEVVGAADEAARAAEGAAGAANKTAGAANKTAGAADKTAAAAEKGTGRLSRLIEGAANSTTGRILGKVAGVAGPSLRFVGRAAGPLLDIIDVAQYSKGNPITGKSKEEVRADFQSDYETLGQRFFAPKSVGEFAGGLGDAASIPKTVLGATESVRQMLKSQRGAREADASLKNAQNVIKAQNDRRKELYPDEEFEKLPRETQRKIRQAIRKEFSDAGVQTFGRNQ
jgi:hypothetical protein